MVGEFKHFPTIYFFVPCHGQSVLTTRIACFSLPWPGIHSTTHKTEETMKKNLELKESMKSRYKRIGAAESFFHQWCTFQF